MVAWLGYDTPGDITNPDRRFFGWDPPTPLKVNLDGLGQAGGDSRAIAGSPAVPSKAATRSTTIGTRSG